MGDDDYCVGDRGGVRTVRDECLGFSVFTASLYGLNR